MIEKYVDTCHELRIHWASMIETTIQLSPMKANSTQLAWNVLGGGDFQIVDSVVSFTFPFIGRIFQRAAPYGDWRMQLCCWKAFGRVVATGVTRTSAIDADGPTAVTRGERFNLEGGDEVRSMFHFRAAVMCMALVFLVCVPRAAWGDCGSLTGTSIINCIGGNVGIGATNPTSGRLVLKDGSFTIEQTGKSTAHFFNFSGPYYSALGIVPDPIVIGTNDQTARPILINYFQNLPGIAISTGGNVGIGTVAPPYKLSVEGAVGAREVIVTNGTWSDYVFRPDYRLRPLSEVNSFIQEHHHLPDIPSEAEVKEKGVNMGEMQSKLLAKIEELTLHMIRAEERNTKLEEQNHELWSRVARLEAAEKVGK